MKSDPSVEENCMIQLIELYLAERRVDHIFSFPIWVSVTSINWVVERLLNTRIV